MEKLNIDIKLQKQNGDIVTILDLKGDVELQFVMAETYGVDIGQTHTISEQILDEITGHLDCILMSVVANQKYSKKRDSEIDAYISNVQVSYYKLKTALELVKNTLLAGDKLIYSSQIA